MQKDYVVLSQEERDQGFVEPVRLSYVHVGQKVCGEVLDDNRVCTDHIDHEGEHGSLSRTVSDEIMARLKTTGYLGGCGQITTMSRPIAETYARSPEFYSGTFCTECRCHRPVGKDGEFVWTETNQRVGTRQA